MDKKKRTKILGGIVAVLLLGIAVFFGGFRVTSVKVEGNTAHTDKEIKKMVLQGSLASNTILVRFLNPSEKTKDDQFIQKVWIERTSSHKLTIHVREKELIGYTKFLDGYLYFDKEGIVQVSTTKELARNHTKELKNIPFIEGLGQKKVQVGQKLSGLTDEILGMLLSATKMMESSEQHPDRIVIENGALTMYFSEIEVKLGTEKNISDKISKMLGILPQLEGMQGVLDLQNVDSTTETIVFKKSETQKSTEENQNE